MYLIILFRMAFIYHIILCICVKWYVFVVAVLETYWCPSVVFWSLVGLSSLWQIPRFSLNSICNINGGAWLNKLFVVYCCTMHYLFIRSRFYEPDSIGEVLVLNNFWWTRHMCLLKSEVVPQYLSVFCLG